MACGADETCTNGACAPNVVTPSGLWNITLVSASIPSTKLNGSSWDPGGGLPDPFLEIATVDSVAQLGWYNFSSVYTNTLNPVWNEEVLGDVTSQAIIEGVEFWFQDDEAFTDDICHEILAGDPALYSGRDLVQVCADDPDMTYTWRIDPAP